MITSVPGLQAVEIGGELEMRTGLFYDDRWFGTFYGAGELEFFIPPTERIRPRLVLAGHLSDPPGGERRDELEIKYSYLRYRQDKGHITLGRQPISWSYGAMLNPFDYGFGVEELAGETISPAADGVRYLRRLGKGRSLQGMVEFDEPAAELFTELGYGLRLRLPRPERDLSFNAAYQPLKKEDNLLRLGAAYSADAGSAGIYGALGYYRLRESGREDYPLQVGMDYSWTIGSRYRDQNLYLQAEYIRFIDRELGSVFFRQLAEEAGEFRIAGGEEADIYDLLAVNLTADVDPFSQIGTALIFETGENSGAFSPYYLTDLGGDLELRLEGNLLRNQKGQTSSGVTAGLTYYF
ncbi:hypothetical protein [Halarsenatibacter silvermanii]|nr:hypothetical protein [Halarsenatibacter silvermanii]